MLCVLYTNYVLHECLSKDLYGMHKNNGVMTQKINRRKLLSGIGAAGIVGLAGCNDTGGDGGDGSDGTDGGDGTDGDEFTYPDGFSESGVEDFATAFGEDSNYYSQRYIQLEGSLTQNGPETEEQTQTFTAQIDGEEELQLFEVESPTQSQTQYYSDETLYVRSQQGDGEPSYQVRQTGFNKRSVYLISLIEPHVTDVDFESTITDENTVEYTATEEEYGDEHPVRSVYTFEEIDVTVEVDEDGLIRTLAGTVVDGDFTQEFTYEFEYSEVDISEPEWTTEAEESQPANPDVSASFSESNGEVTVTLDSINQANRVYVDTSGPSTIEGGITVDGRANYLLTAEGEGGEGESVTVSEYSSDTTIGVFAGVEEMERAQPVQTYDVESGSDGSSDSDTQNNLATPAIGPHQ